MDFVVNNWVSIAVLLLQCGFLELVHRVYKDFQKHKDERETKTKATEIALRSLLRAEIIRICNKAETEDYIAVYNMENLEEMYQAYHALGGNGSISKMHDKAMHLPHFQRGGEKDAG